MSIAVYDFDKTIYRGDATADFHRCCALRYPRVVLDLFASCWWFVGMAMGLVPKTLAKQRFYRFLRFVPDIDAETERFWAGHLHKIKRWYLESRAESDLVISASPEFLLLPACKTLGVRLIASRVDPYTGRALGPNCHDEEKVRRFQEEMPDTVIHSFYSDSFSDTPLARLAEKAWRVRGDAVRPWPIDRL